MKKRWIWMLAAALTWWATPAFAAQDGGGTETEGRAYFDFAVFAYEEGDFAGAEKNLGIALSHAPDNPYYNHYMGKVCLQTGRMADAARFLDKAWSLNPDITGLAYDRAFLVYKNEDFATAAPMFAAVADASGDNVAAHYYAGICHYKVEEYAKAVGYFEAAADKSPTLAANSRYYAGICHEKLRDFSQAIHMFELVRDDPKAGELKGNAERWITALEQRKKTERPVQLFLKVGRRYDTNVRLEPEDDDIFTDESDWGTLAWFSGRYEFLSKDDFRAGVEYSHYQIWYDDLSAYDFTGSLFRIYGSYSLEPFLFRLNYMPTYYWADGDGYLRQHRLEPEISWRISSHLLARLAYAYHDNTYFEDEGKTGHANELQAEMHLAILDGAGRIYGSVGYEDRTATRKDEYFDQWALEAGMVLKLPWEVETGLSGEYEARTYGEADEIYAAIREDDRYTLSAYMSRPLFWPWLGILGEYRYVNNVSTINDYEYQRHVFTVSMTATY